MNESAWTRHTQGAQLMTQTDERPRGLRPELADDVPPHPHFTLGTMATVGAAAAVVALLVAIVAVIIVANRNSVDDALVEDKVDALLVDLDASGPVSAVGSVLPEIVPKAELSAVPSGEVNVSIAPQVPPAATRTAPAIVDVEFEVVEGVSTIDRASGVEFETWGYKLLSGSAGTALGTPGPMIRARVGDVLRFTITNPATNTHPHNVDFHAVTGQGGGAEATTVAPGETRTIEARALYPGMFMYHCAYGDVPAHISHGMYGGILIDPATPLHEVQQEWYVVQSEYYVTDQETGLVEIDREAITLEEPRYVVFNGAVGAIAGDNALQMAVGETARIYFINAGLNLISSFHPIGSHWDTVYQEAALLNQPLRGSQTTLVPAGGGTVVELIGQVPSTVILVDHALARTFDKGALGMVMISGAEQPEIFEEVTPSAGADNGGSGDAQEGDVVVTIVAGAGDVQPLEAPDEFADTEEPVDYSVNVLEVQVGTTVTWTNEDAMLHTVTAVDGSFDSGYFGEGESWSYTFDEVGEWEYSCLPHPWMRARIVVTE